MNLHSFSTVLIIAILSIAGFHPNTQAQFLVKTQNLTENANIYQPVFNPKEGAIYVSAARDFDTKGCIYKLDAETLEVLDSINIPGSAPLGLGINVSTQTLYSTNSITGLVTAINLKTGEINHISSTVPGSSAREVIVDEKRNLIYITSVPAGGGIWVIDGSTNTFDHYIYNLGKTITGADLDVENNILYATAMGDDEIVLVDAQTGIIQKKLEAHGDRPTNVVFDKANNRLLIANQGSGNLTIIDAEKGDLIKAIPTGAGALGVDYDPQRELIYVANRKERTVNVIDGNTLEITETFEMHGLPNTFVINQETGTFWVTNKDVSKRGSKKKKPAKNGDSVSRFEI